MLQQAPPASPLPRLAGLVEMKDITYADVSSLLIYGPPGIGKTELAGNFEPPGFTKRFIIDFEAGLKVIQHKPASVYRVATYDKLYAGITYLEQETEHNVVIVDSMTEMARVIMMGALAMPAAGSGRPMMEIPVLQDWSLTIERMRTMVRRVRLLIQKGKWVIFIASSGINKDALSGRILGGPEVPGKDLPSEVCYLMDEVYRMDAVMLPGTTVSKRQLWTQPDSIWMAKSRVQGAPAVIEVKQGDPNTLSFLWKGAK